MYVFFILYHILVAAVFTGSLIKWYFKPFHHHAMTFSCVMFLLVYISFHSGTLSSLWRCLFPVFLPLSCSPSQSLSFCPSLIHSFSPSVCAMAVRNCLECQQHTLGKSGAESSRGQQSLLGAAKSIPAQASSTSCQGYLYLALFLSLLSRWKF